MEAGIPYTWNPCGEADRSTSIQDSTCLRRTDVPRNDGMRYNEIGASLQYTYNDYGEKEGTVQVIDSDNNARYQGDATTPLE
jgi:hypothetical protein